MWLDLDLEPRPWFEAFAVVATSVAPDWFNFPVPAATVSTRASLRILVAVTVLALAAMVLIGLVPAARGAQPSATRPAALVVHAAYGAGGLKPQAFHRAYALPETGPGGQTIAIVTAYNDPAAAADLATYLATFKLPPCTSASHCLRKVNQQGASAPLPGPDPTGGDFVTEAAVGTEVARGVCENCSILLVEANSASKSDFAAAVASAARLGATVVVTSVAAAEQQGDRSAYAADFEHPATTVVSAAGDNGYTGGVDFPASLPGVIAVGGTHLNLSGRGAYVGETAWEDPADAEGTASGCSLYTAAPAWQAPFATAVGCGSMRSVADIAAVADPGALVYISGVYGTPGGAGYVVGGTSLSAPVIAGAIALAGGGSGAVQRLYQRAHTEPKSLRDITRGTTYGCVIRQPQCAAGPGYDGPTGLGTPYGLAAFLPSGGVLGARRPQMTISGQRGALRAGKSWRVHVGLANHNPFLVTGSITVRAAISGRPVKLATATVKLGPLGSVTQSLVILRARRAALHRLATVTAWVYLRIRGPAGHAVTVRHRFPLSVA